ncbi:MAG: glycosyltransferase family 2 protein [Nitrosopumilus sp.]|nr:glycosyltransferase family 2 protein [Nitrosopumilus sp.]
MKVTGFTFIRNAVKFDYPVVEAITSILPICDNFVVAVGKSEDETRKLIEKIDPAKIKIIDTVWDDNLRIGGKVLAEETNKAFDAIDDDTDWCFYIQGDEVVHEKYQSVIKEEMLKWKNSPEVEGLLLNYKHFYGSYDYVGDSRRWYRKEIRIIKNNKTIRSYKDAQGFRKNNRPLNVKPVDAFIYHYGWVKPPAAQQARLETFHKLWHDENWVNKNVVKASEFDYSKIDNLAKFTGTHPDVMQERIKNKNWKFDFDPAQKKLSLKNKMLSIIEKRTGWRVGEYRNYRVV